MSEKIPSHELAHVLGLWFRESGNLIQRSGGTIDKFIGDALLAYWMVREEEQTTFAISRDAAKPIPSPAQPAECDIAFGAARKIVALAEATRWPNSEPFRIAVALHFGKVAAGNVGMEVISGR